VKKLEVLSQRDNSTIWKVEIDGNFYAYKEITPQPQLTQEGLIRSYENYFNLSDKSDLVQVSRYWVENGKVCVLMEYLDGWVRCEQYHLRMLPIVLNLVRQGFIDWDIGIINFMTKDNGCIMVDLDRLIAIDSLPECPPKEHWELTWFGSRMIKVLQCLLKT